MRKSSRSITEPRSPGTGLRYARLMTRYIDKLSAETSSEKESSSPFQYPESPAGNLVHDLRRDRVHDAAEFYLRA